MLFHYTEDSLHQIAGHLFAALRDGILKPDVRHRYPLAAAADAHRDLEARRTSGQIVLLTPTRRADDPGDLVAVAVSPDELHRDGAAGDDVKMKEVRPLTPRGAGLS